MKTWMCALCLALLCLAGPPAFAGQATADLPDSATSVQAPRTGRWREISLDTGGSILVPSSISGTELGPDRAMGSFFLRAGVAILSQVSLEAQWSKGGQKTMLFAGSATHQLDTHWLSLGARWSAPVATWWRPFVRAGSGAVREAIAVSGGQARFRDSAWTPQIYGAVGFDLLLPPKVFSRRPGAKFTFGVTYEFGYAHAFARDVVLTGSRSLEPSMAQQSLDMGTLTLAGWMHQIAYTVRF